MMGYSSILGASPLITLRLSNIKFAKAIYRVVDPMYEEVRHGGKFKIKVSSEGILLFSVLVDDKIHFSYIVDRIVHQVHLSAVSNQ